MDEIPLVGDDGSTNVSFSIFLISFTLVVSWVVLQLTTIVLLDNYVKASPPRTPPHRLWICVVEPRLFSRPLLPFLGGACGLTPAHRAPRGAALSRRARSSSTRRRSASSPSRPSTASAPPSRRCSAGLPPFEWVVGDLCSLAA